MEHLDFTQKARELFYRGNTIAEIILSIKSTFNTNANECNSLVILKIFKDAFNLTLREARIIEGAACMGNAAIGDDELDSILRPIISERLAQKESK